ncbi:MAG: DUF3365 domain-containing protein [Nitrospirae bacterium]|nr:DUF3365 domain-containing protein [Nitrospirota bacterium]
MSMLVPFRAWRVTSQFVAFIFPVIVLVVGCAAWMIHQQNVSRLQDKLTKRADSITTQILADRDYYASVIVPRLIQMGGIVDADYRLAHGRFPLPVTFVQEVSDAIVAHGGLYKSQLIGPWPINERKGLSDQFQREAFDYIRSHSAEQFFRLDTLEGRAVFRYLSADRATAQSCLDCHNNHPLSPKRDFKLHDVMGGLEIIIPADEYLQEDRRDLLTILAGGTVFCLVLFSVIGMTVTRTISQPLARLGDRMDRQANAITGGVSIPSTWPIGNNELLRFTAFFDQMRALISSQQKALQKRETALCVKNAGLEEEVERQVHARLNYEKRFQLAVNFINDAIIYIDSEGIIQWCNHKAEMLIGEDDLAGRSFWAVLTPESMARAQGRLAAVKRGDTVPSLVELEFVQKTGGL